MIGIITQLVYVEAAAADEDFAWYHGKVLTADQRRERAQIHRELNELAKGAEFDERAQWGRALRCGDRLLVEVDVIPEVEGLRRRIATIVLSVARPDTRWVNEAAEEIAAILNAEDLNIDSDRLAEAFAKGWSRKNLLHMLLKKQPFAAVGIAVGVALWIVGIGRIQRWRRAARHRSREHR
jgi:hypothetical protein